MDTRRRTHKGLKIAVIVLIVIALMAAAAFAAARRVFKVKEINITGSDRYSYDELYKYIFANRNADNTILFSYTNKKAGTPDTPLISRYMTKVVSDMLNTREPICILTRTELWSTVHPMCLMMCLR